MKPGILVELIASNLDTQDGLVNGVDGTFQLHTDNNEDILWPNSLVYTSPTIYKAILLLSLSYLSKPVTQPGRRQNE